jgi:hypothetical protein
MFYQRRGEDGWRMFNPSNGKSPKLSLLHERYLIEERSSLQAFADILNLTYGEEYTFKIVGSGETL